MIITLSGLPGSGKSTLGRRLASALNLEYFYAGGRTLAKELGISLEELNAKSKNDPSFDRKIDDLQIEKAKAGNILIDGRISGHMIPDADIKIFLKASLDERSERIAGREKKSVDEAKRQIEEREKNEKVRYKTYYNIDISDLSVYDIIIDNSNMGPEETFSTTLTKIKEITGENK